MNGLRISNIKATADFQLVEQSMTPGEFLALSEADKVIVLAKKQGAGYNNGISIISDNYMEVTYPLSRTSVVSSIGGGGNFPIPSMGTWAVELRFTYNANYSNTVTGETSVATCSRVANYVLHVDFSGAMTHEGTVLPSFTDIMPVYNCNPTLTLDETRLDYSVDEDTSGHVTHDANSISNVVVSVNISYTRIAV